MSRAVNRNRHDPRARRLRRRRAGFTLIELLVVVTIIGILASVSLAALQRAQSSARISRTKATIAKLNDIIVARYASYRTRRVPLGTGGLAPLTAANRRLNLLRDLMRMEMPQRWHDVVQAPITFNPGPNQYAAPRPALSRSYLRQYNLHAGAPNLLTYESAECLYLVVMFGDRDARGLFSESEIGDADGDGLLEFVDGWGNPIKFLRWAPGVPDSDIQPVVSTISGTSGSVDLTLAAQAEETDYDPFDVRKVDYSTDTTSADIPPRSWRLVPYIFSAGPDGIYDIVDDMDSDSSTAGIQPYDYCGNPYYFLDASNNHVVNEIGLPTTDLTNVSVTAYGETNLSLDHYDNIHNHRIEAD